MPRKKLALYIPGLGDHYDGGRSYALKFWRLFGLPAQLVPIKWYGGGTYEDKLQLVLGAAAKAHRDGYEIILIGESAGASLAINAAALLPNITKIVLLAGVNSSKLPIADYYKKRSPAFVISASAITGSLEQIDTKKIITIRAMIDRVVSPQFNSIEGARTYILPTIGHLTTILLCLTILSPLIIRFIKHS